MDFSTKLLTWYDDNKRDLPWRSNPDPYHIWLSEIMLQQTQMNTALPYFHRFLDKAPTIEALSELTEDELLKLWEGLGYYRRAKNLHLASKIIIEKYQGELPKDYELLRELPGIGEYSAGAISSTAFGIKALAVDGNVERVMSRYYLITEDVTKQKTKKLIKEMLLPLAPEERIGDFNQALMELGALVCLPNGKPKCDVCPLREECLARKEDLALELPIKSKKKESSTQDMKVLLLLHGNEVAILKRKEKGLLESLWQFPTEEDVKAWPTDAVHVASAKHIFSHKIWNMDLYKANVPKKNPSFTWINLSDIDSYPMAKAFGQFKKYIKRD